MPKVLKKELADRLAAEFTVTKMDAGKYVDFLFREIEGHLMEGDEVVISGFGKFTTADTPAKIGRNPKTGAITRFEAKRKVKFLPGPKLRETIQNSLDAK